MSSKAEIEFLTGHSAHDPQQLIKRWRGVARRAGLVMQTFASDGEHELFVLRSRMPPQGAMRVYLSAGVHGDEPAGPLALLRWAEAMAKALRGVDLLLFPLLNPWGFEHNIRLDSRGRDLNRLFHSRARPFPAWRREVGRQPFGLAINLHEDYDARGAYIYELGGRIGEALLAAASRFTPPDPRRKIDGSEAKAGVIRPDDIRPETFPLSGLPEAVWLYFERCQHALTLETPSEFSLFDRVRALEAMLSAAVFPRR